jgi:hypothetical protein
MRFTAQSGTKAAANLSARKHPHGYAARNLLLRHPYRTFRITGTSLYSPKYGDSREYDT